MGLERKLTGQPVLGSLLTFAILFGVLFYRENLFYLPTTIWVITGEKRQSLWNWFLDNVTQDQFTIWVSGTLLILILQYWIIGALYSWMDLTLKPRALRKYKIQPATNEPLEKKKLIQVVKQVLFNQTVVGIPAIYLGGRLFIWRDPPPVRELPEFHWVFLQFLFFLLEQEICYYYVHRCGTTWDTLKSPQLRSL
ncbi:hypothetical protein RUM44_005650 [Polyplax serrata]|uniref:Uncharacterized protein n=1 Tax=Polyplax serrata TaxID=468196 RepID=A0ABR1ADY8_POLSC